jgi:sigma-B regulation protein RsbU (phosphoserine phosphatase)
MESLRPEVLPFLVTCFLTIAGLLMVASALVRRRTRPVQLLIAGILTSLFGLEKTLAGGFVGQVYGELPPIVNWFRSFWLPSSLALGTYFVHALGVRDWRSPVRWILVSTILYSVVSVVADLAVGSPFTLESVRQVITVLWAIAVFICLFDREASAKELTILRVGLGIALAGVVHDNLVNLAVLPWPFLFGPYTFTAFVLALVVIAVHRLHSAEKRLVSFDTEIRAAREIQLSILPDVTPKTETTEIAVTYLPMAGVAGDFYDFLVVDEYRIGILIADVSGHGIPAALVASMVKMAASAQLPEASDPARVMDGINKALCGKLKEQFVTAGYVFLDSQSGLIKYSGAGHPPLLVVRGDGSGIRELEENGLILGVFPEAEYRSVEIEMSASDRLVLYTDGITEAENSAGKMFGVEGLKNTVAAGSAATAKDTLNEVLAAVHAWTEGRSATDPEDDITLLVAKCGTV